MEALRAGLADEVILQQRGGSAHGLRDVEAEARTSGVRVRMIPEAELEALAPNHQGVVGRVRVAPAIGERELRTWSFAADAIVVVLDGILDPQNVGTAARVAEAAGVALLVMRERRAGAVSAAAIRASAGALLHLPRARVANIARALELLKDRGFTVVGLDPDADRSIDDASPPERPTALVVGSEETGMSRLVREACDGLVRLPMAGRVGSLNAATALAAALYGFVLRTKKGTVS
jgi:23S rRNA (guanosine2251-2'-O)-methyltransferase